MVGIGQGGDIRIGVQIVEHAVDHPLIRHCQQLRIEVRAQLSMVLTAP